MIITLTNFFFEEAKMKLHYHIKNAFLTQDMLRKKNQGTNSVQHIFTKQSKAVKSDEKNERR